MCNARHWNKVYATRSPASLPWHQAHARQSLELIEAVAGPDARIIDVGGGASTLVDELLDHGWHDVTVLDIASTALEIACARLGDRARAVTWLQADVTKVALPAAHYDVWHDRGAFHFLTDRAGREAYVRQVRHAVRPGGHVLVAAFGPDGPRYCNGLPVVRFSAEQLHAELGAAFQLVGHVDEQHRTPSGGTQHFVYCHCLLH